MSVSARQLVLAQRPAGAPRATDFRIDTVELGEPGDGEVLVRNLWLSLDPYMRLYMSEQQGVHGSVPLGAPMPGGAVGEVIASSSPALPVGTHVVSMAHGWRDHYIAEASKLQAISPEAGPIQRFLGIYGLTGVTAWGGINGVLKPQAGETLFINGAAGAVGSIAVQLARIAGARVIACAGSDAKGAWLTETLGAQYFINYKTEDVSARLGELAPDGIEMFFDNVGGDQLEIAIDAMKPRGRMALCGAIALYDGENYRAGPRNLFTLIEKHVSLTGFNAGFYFDQAPRIIAEFARLEADGALVCEETVIDGLDTMPQGFVDLLAGANTGKMLVRL
jgi:NADPH-dependent curcumin reductase CurA